MISLRSKITQAVLRYFMAHEDEELYVQEMARRLSVDDGNLTRKLIQLERSGILKSTARGKEKYYSLNVQYPLLDEYKRIINKTIGIEKMLYNAFLPLKGLSQVIIYGSYARDAMDSASDIDVLVVGPCSAIELRKAVAPVQRAINREINIVNMSFSEFTRKKKNDSFIKSVLESPSIRIIQNEI